MPVYSPWSFLQWLSKIHTVHCGCLTEVGDGVMAVVCPAECARMTHPVDHHSEKASSCFLLLSVLPLWHCLAQHMWIHMLLFWMNVSSSCTGLKASDKPLMIISPLTSSRTLLRHPNSTSNLVFHHCTHSELAYNFFHELCLYLLFQIT